MDSDLVTVVTGGAGGEGIKIWDLRNTVKPTLTFDYAVSSLGDPVNRAINAARFIPNTGLLLAGCSYDAPAKCFNHKTGATLDEITSL